MIVNMTPHDVTVIIDKDLSVVFKSQGRIELREIIEPADMIDNIPIVRMQFAADKQIPLYQEGTYYIVSRIIKDTYPFRKDLLVPAQFERNAHGVIIGCKSLSI